MSKLLLHICCTPCSIGVIEELGIGDKELVNNVTGFYYNPNIHPQEEYKKRKDCLVEYAQQNNLPVIWGKYEPEKYFKKVTNVTEVTDVTNVIEEIEKGKIYIPKEIRCPACYKLRLEKTAQVAHEKGFDYFTTTLLVSPYQNLEKVREIGAELAKKYKVKFYFEDFTSGFRKGQNKAKELNLYRQKYCGCMFSKFRI